MSTNTSRDKTSLSAGKTLLFFDRYPVLSERFLHREVAALVKMGYPVEVAALVRDYSCRMPTSVRGVWGNDHSLVEKFRAWFSASYWTTILIVLFSLGPRGAFFLLRRPSTFGRFLKALKGVRAVHSMHGGYCGLAAWTFARMLGVPFSMSCHAHDVFVQRRLLGFLLHRAHAVVVCSETAKAYIESKFPAASGKLSLVHHPSPDLDLRDSSRIVKHRLVAVGRNVKKKDFPTLFAAFKTVKSRFPDATLIICGADSADFADLPAGVTALGMLTFNEVAEQLSQASLLVYCSAITGDGDRDGIPNAIVEAMKLGVPVAAANAGGISELVIANKTGWLVPCSNADAMAQAVCKILTGGEEIEAIVSQARAKVDRDFDPQVQLEKLVKAIGL